MCVGDGASNTDGEMAEVFRKDAAALDEHGFLPMHGGIWVDMERAAKDRTAQILEA
jgi:hypothetical protein